jgi:hypothetical protein
MQNTKQKASSSTGHYYNTQGSNDKSTPSSLKRLALDLPKEKEGALDLFKTL